MIEDLVWRKSSFSYGNGECVEVAVLAGGDVVVRDSKDPGGPMLEFSRGELAAFLAGVKAGEFDDLV
jgi:hypothetical protein